MYIVKLLIEPVQRHNSNSNKWSSGRQCHSQITRESLVLML